MIYPKPERIDKTLQWLEKSRDSWKEKTKATKEVLKIQKLAVKRARNNREELHNELSEEKAAHQITREELARKNTEIETLKAQLEEIKKKRLLQGLALLAITLIGTVL